MPSFRIIPVLDLKGGAVVRARAGDRANYRPIVTPLAASSRPADVLCGLLGLAPFRSFYIADLDAIEGNGDNRVGLEQLADAAPGLEVWLDAGFTTTKAARAALRPGLLPVFGSESLADAGELGVAGGMFGRSGFALSLDYRAGRFLGAPGLEQSVDLWPDRLILMILDRVGANEGPDIDALEGLVQRAGGRAVFAAGGVRGEDDLARLERSGIAGALVATALHDGRLKRETLIRYTG